MWKQKITKNIKGLKYKLLILLIQLKFILCEQYIYIYNFARKFINLQITFLEGISHMFCGEFLRFYIA